MVSNNGGCGRPDCPRKVGDRTFKGCTIADPPSGEAGDEADYQVTVRYGYMRLQSTYSTSHSTLEKGNGCIVQTDRGTEFGEVVIGSREIPTASGRLTPLIRPASERDVTEWRKLVDEQAYDEMDFCQERIDDHGLPMKLVCVEHLFGGEKIIFYFRADGRVDFRALVRDLARRYRTRIEMKQIGVRDEAKLLGDVGHCGRELCCNTFLRKLEPVTMRMAKNQKATLDPSKISGVCGRLMCCLRYEDPTYRELIKAIPRRGSRVNTKYGEGRVVGIHVLAQRVDVRLDGGKEMQLRVETVETIKKKKKKE